MPHLALLEIDKRQEFILGADKLREMLGASRIIEKTVEKAEKAVAEFPGVKLIWPVSGVLWFTSDDLKQLKDLLWQLRTDFAALGLSASYALGDYQSGNFDKTLASLESQIRATKDAKAGEDGSPRSPLFAQCSIQGRMFANYWNPGQKKEPRRRLVSAPSAVKLDACDEYQISSLSRFQFRRHYSEYPELEALIVSDSDSYVALIKADGDGVGRLLPILQWKLVGEWLGCSPETAAEKFSGALAATVKEALRLAVDQITGADNIRRTCFPIIPLIVAGDDLWIVCRRDLAIPFAASLSEHYAKQAEKNDVLRTARNECGGEPLTLSCGILHAKVGFPFDAQLDLAQDIETSAKHYRRDLPATNRTGCVDYHWLESSGRQTFAEARADGFKYNDSTNTHRLFTRPWTAAETTAAVAAARKLAELPRRKRHQLDQIFRFGRHLSELAYLRWRTGLTPTERNTLDAALAALPQRLRPTAASPWIDTGRDELSTPLPELAELAEILEVKS